MSKGEDMSFKHIGLYGYFEAKAESLAVAKQVVDYLAQYELSIYALEDNVALAPYVTLLSADSFIEQIDMLIVIGGDGTFLRGADLVMHQKVPMIGINKGYLGFLSEIEENELELSLDKIFSGQFSLDERMMIKGEVRRNGELIKSFSALNDIVINRHTFHNNIGCEVYLETQFIDYYSGDGMIIATPTGSTGYSLSAGGPLIYPGTDCIIVNPICPHQLGAGAAVVPSDSNIHVVITRAEKEAYAFVDGRYIETLNQGDRLIIKKSELVALLIHVQEHPFFKTVRNKLVDQTCRLRLSRGDSH